MRVIRGIHSRDVRVYFEMRRTVVAIVCLLIVGYVYLLLLFYFQCPDKPNVTNNIVCSSCGAAGHIARDCRQKRPGLGGPGATVGAGGDKAKIDEEYMSLMAELGEGPPPPPAAPDFLLKSGGIGAAPPRKNTISMFDPSQMTPPRPLMPPPPSMMAPPNGMGSIPPPPPPWAAATGTIPWQPGPPGIMPPPPPPG